MGIHWSLAGLYPCLCQYSRDGFDVSCIVPDPLLFLVLMYMAGPLRLVDSITGFQSLRRKEDRSSLAISQVKPLEGLRVLLNLRRSILLTSCQDGSLQWAGNVPSSRSRT